ncbi:counting factor 60 [Thecamonas trahens ATCC 50062]|uniref:Counting factor 60 n=1 Tax=Thecamonas trahens ATCC 50062 TaxID=461836 RepID=A0A0L0D906_THETB|nr:counting factor 60 [Thecamonas trahens ATCC 50062]KNC48551.1 counting factor 60 [Thecamonas trahens ATCC 50062]|eukprot:XP_013762608.1 counting factor 60 [Thecamonas trahens ATCC 50062]
MPSSAAAVFGCALLAFALCCSAQTYPLPYCSANSSVAPSNPWLKSTFDTDEYSLALVQLIFRHGDRVPVVGLPGAGNEAEWTCQLSMVDKPATGSADEGYLDEPRLFRFTQLENRGVLPGNCSLGQLTEKGHVQHNIIGSHFRELYHDTYGFIPSEYNSRDVWVRAINIPRCRQSAQSEIQGIFPNVYERGPVYEAVPIHTMDPNYENMSPNFAACPNLLKRIAEQQQSQAWADFRADTKGLTSHILSLLHLESESAIGSTQYPFFIGSTFDQVVDAGTWTVNHWLFNETMASISVGTFFGELLTAMEDVMSAGSAYDGPILRLYGGQDLTIGPLLNCLGAYNGAWPPYAAHLSMELLVNNAGDYFVHLLYNGDEIVVPGCSAICPWSKFISLVGHNALTPAQYATMCGAAGPQGPWSPINAAMYM